MPAQIKITKRTVDRITGDGSDKFYWDDDLPGFGLRVRASGRKYYVVQFRANGRLRRMTLGRHGAVTPETARRRAMALISEAKGGKDPAALRDKGRKAATMKVLGKRFLEEYVPVHCKPSTAYEYQRSVKFFIDPRIGTRKVTEIQRSDIAELHHGMRETPYQANRTLGVLSKMFNLAELWGLRPDGSNPCLHVKRYKEEKRERFLSAEEFTRRNRSLKPWNQRGRFNMARRILTIERAFPVPSQGPEPDILFRLVVLPVPVVAPAPLGGADMDPARCSVDRPGISRGLYERLDEHGRGVVALGPVVGQASADDGEDVRTQVGYLDPGQDEEPRIVDHQREVLLLQLRCPSR